MGLAVATIVAAFLVWALIGAFLPWLRRRAMAAVVGRSSHVVPTPQGAGLAVVPVVVASWLALWAMSGVEPPGGAGQLSGTASLAGVLGGATCLCVIGFMDDISTVPLGVRLLAQTVAVCMVVLVLPPEARLLPPYLVPMSFERGLLVLAGVWFVNLCNFMDGIDWLTFVEVVTIGGGIVALWAAGIVDARVGPPALLLCGAMAGFAVWNRPRASIFLGDAGSLPIGLLLVWLLLETALQGAWTAALLFSLYYWADATLTLIARLRRGEKVWVAHREHFYQQGTRKDRFSVPGMLALIAGANTSLVGLGVAAESLASMAARLCAIALGSVVVAGLLWVAADRRPPG